MNAYLTAITPLSTALSELLLAGVRAVKRLVTAEPVPSWTDYLHDDDKG